MPVRAAAVVALVPVGLREALAILGDGEIRPEQGARLVGFMHELAARFHGYYTRHRIISADRALSRARLALVAACRVVVGNALGLLGVSAPDRM